jgi:hypothetical protein
MFFSDIMNKPVGTQGSLALPEFLGLFFGYQKKLVKSRLKSVACLYLTKMARERRYHTVTEIDRFRIRDMVDLGLTFTAIFS